METCHIEAVCGLGAKLAVLPVVINMGGAPLPHISFFIRVIEVLECKLEECLPQKLKINASRCQVTCLLRSRRQRRAACLVVASAIIQTDCFPQVPRRT